MYTRQETSLQRKKFWTGFGKYMRPITGADGDTINWINYKTGLRHIYFRMDVTDASAIISIELRHADTLMQLHYYEQLLQLKGVLEQSTGEEWEWELHKQDEDGNTVSRISKKLSGVNIMNKNDWPAIISFLKPRIIALDAFWDMVKDGFE